MITTRLATVEDAAILARLNQAFNEVSEPPELLAKRLADPRRVETSILAEVGEAPESVRVAGFACVRIVPCVLYDEPHAELTELYVEQAYRRLGVGRALVAHAERLAHEAGATRLILLTGFDNAEAQAFYRALGYVADELMMSKDLNL
jgi:ribosomal protein S18 acetylase RimI-like enzyme